jgi:adenine-specific DNA methylase
MKTLSLIIFCLGIGFMAGVYVAEQKYNSELNELKKEHLRLEIEKYKIELEK